MSTDAKEYGEKPISRASLGLLQTAGLFPCQCEEGGPRYGGPAALHPAWSPFFSTKTADCISCAV